jgi:hypothetical protein
MYQYITVLLRSPVTINNLGRSRAFDESVGKDSTRVTLESTIQSGNPGIHARDASFWANRRN